MLRRVRSERGFTLVEVLAALMVFTIVTLGVVPLLAASLRGSNLARTSNISKNLAVRAMERVRGLPFHRGLVTRGGVVVPVDVIDLYHPGALQPTVTVCDSTTDAVPACPKDIPAGYTMTFRATFVQSDGVTPSDATGHNANSSATEEPPSSLLHMRIVMRWTAVTGQIRRYELDGLIGDRAFGGLDVRGIAHVEYGVQVITSFEDADGETYNLNAVAGNARSDVQVRVDETSDQTVQAATMTLRDQDGASADRALGAVADLHAPPSQAIVPPVSDNSPDTISVPSSLRQVAGVDASSATNLRVFAAGDTPEAHGTFSLLGTGTTDRFWVDNPPEGRGTRAAELDLIPTSKLLALSIVDEASMEGSTRATTGDAGIAGVDSEATVGFESLRLFPTQFILDQDPRFGGAVVAVEDFQATVTCEAAGTGLVNAPTVEWEATLSYWRDERDGETNGAYVDVPLSGDAPEDLLDAVVAADPLVYEQDPAAVPIGTDATTLDRYLFDFDDDDRDNFGYLRSWDSTIDVDGNVFITDDERAAQADLDGAIRIDTVDVPALGTEFPFTVTMGSLNCEAVDFRP